MSHSFINLKTEAEDLMLFIFLRHSKTWIQCMMVKMDRNIALTAKESGGEFLKLRSEQQGQQRQGNVLPTTPAFSNEEQTPLPTLVRTMMVSLPLRPVRLSWERRSDLSRTPHHCHNLQGTNYVMHVKKSTCRGLHREICFRYRPEPGPKRACVVAHDRPGQS
jgi:hypothetical protein